MELHDGEPSVRLRRVGVARSLSVGSGVASCACRPTKCETVRPTTNKNKVFSDSYTYRIKQFVYK